MYVLSDSVFEQVHLVVLLRAARVNHRSVNDADVFGVCFVEDLARCRQRGLKVCVAREERPGNLSSFERAGNHAISRELSLASFYASLAEQHPVSADRLSDARREVLCRAFALCKLGRSSVPLLQEPLGELRAVLTHLHYLFYGGKWDWVQVGQDLENHVMLSV